MASHTGDIKLAMLGMVDGNGHPFSWSAIINGEYDVETMAQCGYAAIPEYLGKEPKENLGIPGAKVTHVWCDDPDDSDRVAKAACIPNVVEKPTDVIGEVDGVFIATDIGHEHVERARPFIEANIPVFIDKPLTDNVEDLIQFIQWQQEGKAFITSSCMRYAREFCDLKKRLGDVGESRLITVSMAKTWERYGIHALESTYAFLEPGGYTSVTHSGTDTHNILHLAHESGVETILAVIDDLYGAFGHVHVYGTEGHESAEFKDTFYAFKTQLSTFVNFVRNGEMPDEFSNTIEQMSIIIAGITSRNDGGRTVSLTEIGEQLP